MSEAISGEQFIDCVLPWYWDQHWRMLAAVLWAVALLVTVIVGVHRCSRGARPGWLLATVLLLSGVGTVLRRVEHLGVVLAVTAMGVTCMLAWKNADRLKSRWQVRLARGLAFVVLLGPLLAIDGVYWRGDLKSVVTVEESFREGAAFLLERACWGWPGFILAGATGVLLSSTRQCWNQRERWGYRTRCLAAVTALLMALGVNWVFTGSIDPYPWAHAEHVSVLRYLRYSHPGILERPTAGRGLPMGPLAAAASEGDLPALRALIEAGASPLGPEQKAVWFFSPLSIAAMHHHADAVEYLLSAGADPNGYEAGSTPLHHAARFGAPEIIPLMLAGGADPNVKAKGGITALHYLAQDQAAGNPSQQQAISALLKAGADPNALDADGRSPLHWAAETGRVEVVQVLLTAGANPELRDREGLRPADLAALSKHPEAQRLLLGGERR